MSVFSSTKTYLTKDFSFKGKTRYTFWSFSFFKFLFYVVFFFLGFDLAEDVSATLFFLTCMLESKSAFTLHDVERCRLMRKRSFFEDVKGLFSNEGTLSRSTFRKLTAGRAIFYACVLYIVFNMDQFEWIYEEIQKFLHKSFDFFCSLDSMKKVAFCVSVSCVEVVFFAAARQRMRDTGRSNAWMMLDAFFILTSLLLFWPSKNGEKDCKRAEDDLKDCFDDDAEDLVIDFGHRREEAAK